jgi:peroxiredoxin 2/4
VSFPLIGDVPRRLSHSFGVFLEDEGVAARATFLLDPEGRVASVTANALEVGRSVAETLRLVQAFQAGGLTACERRPGDRLLVPA